MRKIIFPLVLTVLAAACDAPQRIRNPGGSFSDGVNSSNGSGVGFDNGGTSAGNSGTTTGSSTGTTAGSTTGTTTGSGTSISCVSNVTGFHAGLGNVGVCQDSANEVRFQLTFSTTDQSDGTCIVPMFRDSSGKSTYLGNAQCTKHNQNQVIVGTVSKNRTGHAGYQINSVMILKYSSTNAFFQCMNAYGVAYNSCMQSYGGNPFYQNYCDGQGNTYMNNLCNTFRSNHPYAQVTTR